MFILQVQIKWFCPKTTGKNTPFHLLQHLDNFHFSFGIFSLIIVNEMCRTNFYTFDYLNAWGQSNIYKCNISPLALLTSAMKRVNIYNSNLCLCSIMSRSSSSKDELCEVKSSISLKIWKRKISIIWGKEFHESPDVFRWKRQYPFSFIRRLLANNIWNSHKIYI